jgi:hypothetical protein
LFLLLNECIYQIVAELRLPLIAEGPITSNDVNHNIPFNKEESVLSQIIQTQKLKNQKSKPRPVIENIDVKSIITKRIDRTTINCLVKNPSIYSAQEIALSIELPFTNYHVTNMSLQLLGNTNIYVGKHEESAELLYEKMLKRKQSVVMIKEITKNGKSNDGVKMLSLSAVIPSEEKVLITLQYEGPLIGQKSSNRSNNVHNWNHMVHINPHQLVEDYKINLHINETLPINNVTAIDVRNGQPEAKLSSANVKYGDTPETIHVVFLPKKSEKQSEGYDMNGQFITSYSRDKDFLLSKVGQDISDVASVVEKVGQDISEVVSVVELENLDQVFEIESLDQVFDVLVAAPFLVLPLFLMLPILTLVPLMVMMPFMIMLPFIFMIPFLIIPFIIMAPVLMIFSAMVGMVEPSFFKNKISSEHELDHELEKVDNALSNPFEDTFDSNDETHTILEYDDPHTVLESLSPKETTKNTLKDSSKIPRTYNWGPFHFKYSLSYPNGNTAHSKFFSADR